MQRVLITAMEKTKQVVLYGNSLVVSAIASCLRDRQGLEITRIEAGSSDLIEQLIAPSPDVVIFDVGSVRPDFGIAFLEKHPGISVIGFDLKNSKILALSSAESKVLTTDDLVRVIQMQDQEHA